MADSSDDNDKKVKENVYRLARLFVDKNVYPGRPYASGRNDTTSYDQTPTGLLNQFVTDIAFYDSHETIKNIVFCCLLHRMLVERHSDPDHYKHICNEITHRDYIPGDDECNTFIQTTIPTRFEIVAVFETKKNSLPQTPSTIIVSLTKESFAKALEYPTMYASTFFTDGIINSPPQTLWALLCNRNNMLPLKTNREIILKHLNDPYDNNLQKTNALLIRQLLFHC
jgi:hypothetical protein